MDDGSVPIRGIIVFILCVVLNGILYGFSAALGSLCESEVEKRAEEGDSTAAKLKAFLDEPRKLSHAIRVMTVLTGEVMGIVTVKDFVLFFPEGTLQYVLSVAALVVVTSFLTLVAGVFLIQRICSRYAEKSGACLVGAAGFLTQVLSPLTWMAVRLGDLLARLFGIDAQGIEEDVTEEDLLSVVDEAHEQGVIEENEAEMIQNIIDFGDKEARDIMTHRTSIIGLDGDMLLEDAIDVMVEETRSRYPVYQGNLDNIIGIIHLKDVVKLVTEDDFSRKKSIRDVQGLIRTVEFIPETRGISDIFESMQKRKVHMAIVVDEYGQTAGLVAMEDILEEIVGEIQDEYDEEEDNIQTQKDNSLLIDGMTHLDQVGEELGLDFEQEEFETLNGYLTSVLGHIPGEEDREVFARGYRFQILSIKNNTIQQVRAEKIQNQEEGEIKQCQDIQNLPT